MQVLAKRRRREGKTDYLARKTLLKPGVTRIVFRKTNKYILGQVVESVEAQDKVIASATSKDLLESGWPASKEGSLKSLPAAYLTGIVLGKAAQAKKINYAIMDIGLNRNIPKSRIYAFVSGVIDSGMRVPCDKKVLPEKERIEGEDKEIKALVQKMRGK
jgi:large subunit ribosomal protein L18